MSCENSCLRANGPPPTDQALPWAGPRPQSDLCRVGPIGKGEQKLMRILITGNMGYVGPVVVRHLRARFPDAELVGFDSGLFAHCLTGGEHFSETAFNRQGFCD